MQGILMDRNVSVWRKAAVPGGGYSDTRFFKSLPCAIVPVSTFGTVEPFARESTHVMWVPYWAVLRKEDQIRDAIALPNPPGDVQPWIFTIVSRRDFRLGIPQIAYYARELD